MSSFLDKQNIEYKIVFLQHFSNHRASRILSSIAFKTIKSQTGEKQKARFQENFLHNQIFQTFEKLELDFGISFKKC